MNTFLMVHGIGSGAPTVRHKTQQSAITEAKRLARVNPGVDFVVLKAESLYRKRDVDEFVLTHDDGAWATNGAADDGIPF